MILRQLRQLIVAQKVGARVADVPDRHDASFHQRDGHRRAHAASGGVLARVGVDATVCFADQLDGLLRRGKASELLLAQRLGGKPGSDLSGLCAPHSIGDGEERRLTDEGVLVSPPSAAGIGVGA